MNTRTRMESNTMLFCRSIWLAVQYSALRECDTALCNKNKEGSKNENRGKEWVSD